MRASASAGAPAISRSELIGERVDLTYPYDASRCRSGDARRARGRPQCICRGAEEGRAADGHCSAGRRWRAATARRSLRWRRRSRRLRRGRRRLERLLGPAHRGRARRRARSRLRAGRRARSSAAQMAEPGALDLAVPARRRRNRHRRRRLRRLYRHARRPRRAPRRRHPAGRRLSGEVRHLRQHRRPRADGDARRVPAGRGARGLGDPARAVRRARATSCPTIRWRRLRQAIYAAHPHLHAARADRARRSRR